MPSDVPPPDTLLVGPASLDRYLATGRVLPGGGALNMACHWSRRGRSFELVTRVAAHDVAVFRPFFERHAIRVSPHSVRPGESCSVDVVFGDDRQPWMDNFVEGLWGTFEFTGDELDSIGAGIPTHLVLVDVVDAALLRLADAGRLRTARLTGDFLSFRHFTPDRFAETFRHLEIGFIGWPGDADDPLLDRLGAHVGPFGNVLVVTLGSRGVDVFDGRSGTVEHRWFDVDARPVVGTTVGCGDAFIAGFLDAWFRTDDLAAAIDAGRELGAEATAWMGPLPDAAYADAP